MGGLIARVVVVFCCLWLTTAAAAQTMPVLNNDQRTLLTALLAAVDATPPAADAAPESWQTHVLRASDGSHYVAFSVASTAATPIDAKRLLLYVRLATLAAPVATAPAERSMVREWLGGSRVDPRLLPRRGIVLGDMPAMGTASGFGRRHENAAGSTDLTVMALQRDRDRQRREEQERQRRAGLEGSTAATVDLLPFEDFDFVTPEAFADGTARLQRALTTGPGVYRLSMAWVDAAGGAGKAPVHLAQRLLDLPPALPDEFRISSVVVADEVSVRPAPYAAIEQRAHPYSLGLTEIRPARDTVFANSEPLSLAFQVINAQAPSTGKPDVTVGFRITRQVGNREEQVATLTPLRYDTTTLPPDFDVRLGHPLIAAMSVPLVTLSRGAYQLHIAATDHGTTTTTHSAVGFSVIGTPLSLLAEAPPLGRPFRRESALAPEILVALVSALTPTSPSPALGRALGTAAAGKFADLLIEEPVPANEQGIRAALTGLALYSAGDSSAVPFQRAIRQGAPVGPAQFMLGAVRATTARDADAITAWQAAVEAGFPADAVALFLVEAYLRRDDPAPAAALVAATLAGRPPEGTWARALAASHLANGRDQEALAVLDTQLAATPDDLDGRWLQLQALFGRVVRDGGAGRDRFKDLARAYIAADGVHANLAAEWVKVLNGSERF